MNPQVSENQNIPLLFYDMESVNSERNLSSLNFVNYYKEPTYIVSGGLISEMFISTCSFGEKYLGMNYDPERESEELAQEKAGLMDFHSCLFHIKRSYKHNGILNGICSINEGYIEHEDDLLVTNYLQSDKFDNWLSIIQNNQNFKTNFNIKFNQDARDLFIGTKIMNSLGDCEHEKAHFNLRQISISLIVDESSSEFQLSHPTA